MTRGAHDWQHIRDFLTDRGAHELAHPGRTLYEHLVRVADLLATWRADVDLQAAGLCHACYGADGYPPALLALSDVPAAAGDRMFMHQPASGDRPHLAPLYVKRLPGLVF